MDSTPVSTRYRSRLSSSGRQRRLTSTPTSRESPPLIDPLLPDSPSSSFLRRRTYDSDNHVFDPDYDLPCTQNGLQHNDSDVYWNFEDEEAKAKLAKQMAELEKFDSPLRKPKISTTPTMKLIGKRPTMPVIDPKEAAKCYAEMQECLKQIEESKKRRKPGVKKKLDDELRDIQEESEPSKIHSDNAVVNKASSTKIRSSPKTMPKLKTPKGIRHLRSPGRKPSMDFDDLMNDADDSFLIRCSQAIESNAKTRNLLDDDADDSMLVAASQKAESESSEEAKAVVEDDLFGDDDSFDELLSQIDVEPEVKKSVKRVSIGKKPQPTTKPTAVRASGKPFPPPPPNNPQSQCHTSSSTDSFSFKRFKSVDDVNIKGKGGIPFKRNNSSPQVPVQTLPGGRPTKRCTTSEIERKRLEALKRRQLNSQAKR